MSNKEDGSVEACVIDLVSALEGADKVFSMLLVFTTSVGSCVSTGAIWVSTSISRVKAAVASLVSTSTVSSKPSVGDGISVGTGNSVGELMGMESTFVLTT